MGYELEPHETSRLLITVKGVPPPPPPPPPIDIALLVAMGLIMLGLFMRRR